MSKSEKKTPQKNAGKNSAGGAHAVKIVRIKNKYMFTPAEQDKNNYEPEGVHTYIVFKDEQGLTRAIRTTHLYEKKKEKQIKKDIILAMKLPNIKFPSGITHGIIKTDIDGEELDLKKVHAVNVKSKSKRATYLTKKQAEKAIGFALKKGKKKKEP